MLPGIRVFDNRADYKASTGSDAPPYNPDAPIQFWFDTDLDRTGRDSENPYQLVDYNMIVMQTVNGIADVGVLTTCSVPGFIAETVNLPSEEQNAAPYDNRIQMQFPLDESIKPEQIQSSPFGFTIVPQSA